MLIHTDDEGHELICRDSASEGFVTQLAETEFGTADLRYRRLDCDHISSRLYSARYLELHKHGQLIGTYMFCPQRLSVDDIEVGGTYRGLLTVAPDRQSSGAGRILVRGALDWLRQHTAGQAHITFGCIDKSNERSMRLLESMGAERLGELRSMLVYRQWTKRDDSVEIVDDARRVSVALQTEHADCGLKPLSQGTGSFYAVIRGGRLVAGARAEIVRLNVAVPGGFWSRIYGNMIDVFPPAKRRFDPRNFRYVRLHDVVATEDSAADWRALLKDILHRHGVHMAMFVMDPGRATFARLENAGLFGRFSQLTKQDICVVGNALHSASVHLPRIIERPLAVGPSDM